MAKPPVKAHELASALADEIRRGDLAAGSWLPSERQLAETRHVGRSTARQAIQMLAEMGFAESQSGSGARVRSDVLPRQSDGNDPDVRHELGAIREQLNQITARLGAIEANTGTTDSHE
jgi:DNA-binding FadR family transcriptional regulator